MDKSLTWEEVDGTARAIFDLFSHRRELDWARDAWERLAGAGLTTYTNGGADKSHVVIRLLALGEIFWDWCKVADWQDWETDLLDWADDAGIGAFRLGQMAGSTFGADEGDEYELRQSAIQRLTAKAREEVLDALLESNGGDDGFFLALWRINNPAPPDAKPAPPAPPATTLFPEYETVPDRPTVQHSLFDDTPATESADAEDGTEDEESADYEDDWAVMNNLTTDKMCAYEWVVGGCEKLRQ